MVPLERLTEDQLDAVQANSQQHRVIIGGPGSGKSLVLIHRAHRLIAQGCSPTAVKVFVFTKVLAQYLQQSAYDIGLPPDLVISFDRWCLGMYKQHVSSAGPQLGSSEHWTQMRSAVLEALKSKSVEPEFDAVLVDEGQDLTDDMLEILQRTSRHVTVALDSRQDLYNTNINVARVCEILGVARPSASLLSSYRCTPLIVELAASFLPHDDERRKFKLAHLIAVAGVERPVAFQWESEVQEFDELAARLIERAYEGHSAAVLLSTNALVDRYAQELRARKLDVQVVSRNSVEGEDLDFLRPMLVTYHSVKGLTVDSVFLPGLTEANFAMAFLSEPHMRRRLLFVGLTRATAWAWLGIPKNGALTEVAQLTDRAASSTASGLVVMRPKSQVEPKPISPTPDVAATVNNQNRTFADDLPTPLRKAKPAVRTVVRAPAVKPSAIKPTVKSVAKKPLAKPVARKAAAKPATKPLSSSKPAPKVVNPDPRLTDLL